MFTAEHLQNFLSQYFSLEKFSMHQFDSRIHVNGYILYLQELWQVSTLPPPPFEDYSTLITASLELTTLLNSFCMTAIMD